MGGGQGSAPEMSGRVRDWSYERMAAAVGLLPGRTSGGGWVAHSRLFLFFFWVRLGRIQIRGVRVAPSSVFFSAIRHVLDWHRQGSPFADT
jgi:hypothetical protein